MTLGTLLLQELGKFESIFKDPKAMDLLADYARELEDPKVSTLPRCIP